MKKIYLKQSALIIMLLLSSFCQGQNLVHYWNFNNSTSEATITTPSQTNGGAALAAVNAGTSIIDFVGGTGQNFDISNLNSRNSDVAGTHLRYSNPIGGALIFTLPTSGYQNIIVKFATRRSSSGAGTQSWSYSLDGTSYVAFTTVTPNNGDPGLATLDFSTITGANNNANFKLKVEFSAGLGGTAGNNRFDNFTVEGLGGSLSTKNFQGIVTSFNIIAYPNPFDSAFRLDLKSANNDDVEMKVYDMVGKLLETRKFDATKMNNQDSGNNYPSGIYNIVFKQGENTKTLRVIKK